MFVRHLLPAFLWALMILALCALPAHQIPEVDTFLNFDKLVHLILYCVLVLATIVGLKKQYSFRKLRYYAIKSATIFGILYGVFIEVLQATVFTTRSLELQDIFANVLGSFLGILCFFVIYGISIHK